MDSIRVFSDIWRVNVRTCYRHYRWLGMNRLSAGWGAAVDAAHDGWFGVRFSRRSFDN